MSDPDEPIPYVLTEKGKAHRFPHAGYATFDWSPQLIGAVTDLAVATGRDVQDVALDLLADLRSRIERAERRKASGE